MCPRNRRDIPDTETTDSTGRLRGWWVAGRGPTAALELHLPRQGTADAVQTLTATVSGPHRNLAPAPYLSFATPPFDAYQIDAIPVTDPDFTSYQVIGWQGAYAGLQRWDGNGGHLLIWSLWDTGGVSAAIVDAPTSSSCDPFGGSEGTGLQCLFPYPWQTGRTYRFTLRVTHRVPGRTDYRLDVEDVATGVGTYVATLRYGASLWPSNPGTFLEQFAGDQDSCLDSEQRMVRWANIQPRAVGQTAYTPVSTGSFSRPYDPSYGHGSLCFNYAYGIEDGAFFTSAGGDRVGRPCGSEVDEPCADVNLP